MKFNPTAFYGIDDRKYRNWEGYSLVYSYTFIETIKPYLDLEDINVVFDIGSRDSCQAMELSDWFPESKVHLFEPVLSSFEYCLEYTKNRSNIYCNNIALSNFSGESTFYQVVNGNIGASSLLQVIDDFTNDLQQLETKVKVETAKNYIEKNNIKHVDLLWVDIQGSEIDCFSGFDNHINNVKAIYTEVGINSVYKGGANYSDLISYMDNKGFTAIKNIENNVGLEVDVIFLNKKYTK